EPAETGAFLIALSGQAELPAKAPAFGRASVDGPHARCLKGFGGRLKETLNVVGRRFHKIAVEKAVGPRGALVQGAVGFSSGLADAVPFRQRGPPDPPQSGFRGVETVRQGAGRPVAEAQGEEKGPPFG